MTGEIRDLLSGIDIDLELIIQHDKTPAGEWDTPAAIAEDIQRDVGKLRRLIVPQ